MNTVCHYQISQLHHSIIKHRLGTESGGKLKNSCNVELTKSGVPNGCAFPPLLKTRIIIKILVGYQVHFNAYSQIELCFVSNNGAPNFIFLLLNDDL